MRKNRQTAKYHIKSYIIAGSLAGAISMALALPVPVMAAQQSLASVTGQAQIQPMGDGSGKYMMKSDGFYPGNGVGICRPPEESIGRLRGVALPRNVQKGDSLRRGGRTDEEKPCQGDCHAHGPPRAEKVDTYA